MMMSPAVAWPPRVGQPELLELTGVDSAERKKIVLLWLFAREEEEKRQCAHSSSRYVWCTFCLFW